MSRAQTNSNPSPARPRQSTVPCLFLAKERFYHYFFTPAAREELERYLPGLERIEPDCSDSSFLEKVRQAAPEILITCWSTPNVIKEWIDQEAENLGYVCNLTGEVSRFLPRSFIERGGVVSNWGETISPVVAEAALFHILSALRRSKSTVLRTTLDGGWNENADSIQTLIGKKVGLHGFGSIARHLVRLLRPFNVQITAYSEPVPADEFARHGVQRATSLAELFSCNDVIVEVEALTEDTFGLIDRRLLMMIPEKGVFVNIGRGAVVNERDLTAVAQERNIQFSLDVFETEPLPANSLLRSLPNVFLTPHVAGPHGDSAWRCGDFALANLKRYGQGEEVEGRIDLERFDRMT